MKFPSDFIGKTKDTSFKEGVLCPLQGYRLEFPNKVSFFSGSAYPWQHGDATAIFAFPQFVGNFDIRI